ncbi:hypothetical protein Cgig2_003906 [Carnegiea gigantea]|uniref:Uncharacterized protein n=1 Tax=Carnegiea gigantea TaxID=171969 RepID=A0A9Q1JM82_9CARY|nr:hypothetical protein Cgig2_003906 [Carnegiea gigantea]
MQHPLRKLNRDKFADLHEQQARFRDKLSKIQQQMLSDPHNESHKAQERECREQYIEITTSVISLVQQQCKVDRIQYGDECTRYFFARAKGRKMASYIYALQDETGTKVEGFDSVGTILLDYYKKMLGKQFIPGSHIIPERENSERLHMSRPREKDGKKPHAGLPK